MKKLVATTETVTIKWFVYSMGIKLPRTASMRGAWEGYDFKCSCGYQSLTGGAIKSWVMDMVEDHKVYDHGYKRDYTDKKSARLIALELHVASITGKAGN